MILAILLPVFLMNFSEYRYRQIDDSIAGPIKGRETVPLMTTHTSGFATSTTLIFLGYIQTLLCAPMLTTKQVFYILDCGLNASILFFSVVNIALLTSFMMTLCFENKLGKKSTALCVLVIIGITGDYDGVIDIRKLL